VTHERLCSKVTEGEYCTRIYQLPCLRKEFAERLDIVLIVCTHLLLKHDNAPDWARRF